MQVDAKFVSVGDKGLSGAVCLRALGRRKKMISTAGSFDLASQLLPELFPVH